MSPVLIVPSMIEPGPFPLSPFDSQSQMVTASHEQLRFGILRPT